MDYDRINDTINPSSRTFILVKMLWGGELGYNPETE